MWERTPFPDSACTLIWLHYLQQAVVWLLNSFPIRKLHSWMLQKRKHYQSRKQRREMLVQGHLGGARVSFNLASDTAPFIWPADKSTSRCNWPLDWAKVKCHLTSLEGNKRPFTTNCPGTKTPTQHPLNYSTAPAGLKTRNAFSHSPVLTNCTSSLHAGKPQRAYSKQLEDSFPRWSLSFSSKTIFVLTFTAPQLELYFTEWPSQLI